MMPILKYTTENEKGEKGSHLGTPQDHDLKQGTATKARHNQRTGLSYRKGAPDYNHSIKWTERMNRELYFMYLQSKLTEKGYQRHLKVLWDESFPEYTHLTSRYITEQVRNIK